MNYKIQPMSEEFKAKFMNNYEIDKMNNDSFVKDNDHAMKISRYFWSGWNAAIEAIINISDDKSIIDEFRKT